MARVRGRDLIDALDFVRQSHGEAALSQVFTGLAPDTRAIFSSALRESEWYPLDQLVSFLVTAKRRLARDDRDFYRAQGYYAGQRQKASFLGVMVATPEAREKTAATIWRMFYDVGRLLVVGTGPGGASQIHDFPTTPELCERFAGIWEGIIGDEEHKAVAIHTRCVLRGDECCEFRVDPVSPTP
jgi:hypothetical protein